MTETLTLPAEARAARTDRIPVAVLGATGSVGQRFVQARIDEEDGGRNDGEQQDRHDRGDKRRDLEPFRPAQGGGGDGDAAG